MPSRIQEKANLTARSIANLPAPRYCESGHGDNQQMMLSLHTGHHMYPLDCVFSISRLALEVVQYPLGWAVRAYSVLGTSAQQCHVLISVQAGVDHNWDRVSALKYQPITNTQNFYDHLRLTSYHYVRWFYNAWCSAAT